jgi:hypothetical protein
MPEILDRRISFNAGEISPWLDPRLDLDKYRMGCHQMENMRPTIYGGALRRAGTEYIGAAKTAATACRLIPFTREISTNYLLEFSHLKMRVWDAATKALVVIDTAASPNTEIDSPYTAAQLDQLQFAQQNDVLFLAHPDHFPRLVTRLATGQWAISKINIDWPATLGPNISLTTITPLVDIYATVEPIAWAAGTIAAGQKRKHDGNYYISVVETTSITPGTAAALGKWIEGRWVNAAGPTDAAYSSATKYVQGARVTYNSKTYSRTALFSGDVKGWSPNEDYGDYQLWDVALPAAAETALAMVPAGNSIILKSSAAVWEASHVGTKFLIGHARDTLKYSFKPNDQAIGYATEPLYVLGEWTAQVTIPTNPTAIYEVSLMVERSTNLVDWEPHYGLNSQTSGVQQLLTGSEDMPVFLRLKLQNKTGDVPNNLSAELVAASALQHGIVLITTFTSATQVTVTVETPIWRYLPTTKWEEPVWIESFGYPRAVTLHENRLFYGGNKRKPTTVWGSAVDAYQDFRLAANDDRAVIYTLASDESSAVEWLVSLDMLVIGTSSGEWVMGSRPGDEAPKLRRNTSFGSAPIQARAIADAIVFIQRSRRKLREFTWSFERDGYNANDLTMLSEHLGDAEFRQIAIQRARNVIQLCRG